MYPELHIGPLTLQQMIDRAAVDNEVSRLGLVTPDSAVAQSIQTTPANAPGRAIMMMKGSSQL